MRTYEKDIELINNTVFNIDEICKNKLLKNNFFDCSIQVLKLSQSDETNFLKFITFFYGLFFERGRISVDYVIDKMQLYTLNTKVSVKCKKEIEILRTYLFHSLNLQKHSDSNKISYSHEWFYSVCNKTEPNSEDDWEKCCDNIIHNSMCILENIYQCLLFVKEDYDLEFILEDWTTKINKDFPDYKLEEIATKVMNMFEVQIDAYTFVKKYSSIIRNRLELIKYLNLDKYKIDIQNIIEDVLFSERSLPCPVSGDDIKEYFGILDGKKIGDLKRKAITLFNSNIYLCKDDILAKLKDE